VQYTALFRGNDTLVVREDGAIWYDVSRCIFEKTKACYSIFAAAIRKSRSENTAKKAIANNRSYTWPEDSLLKDAEGVFSKARLGNCEPTKSEFWSRKSVAQLWEPMSVPLQISSPDWFETITPGKLIPLFYRADQTESPGGIFRCEAIEPFLTIKASKKCDGGFKQF